MTHEYALPALPRTHSHISPVYAHALPIFLPVVASKILTDKVETVVT